MSLLFRDLEKQYGHRLVFGKASGRLEPGRCAGVIGSNASGKTTLLRLLAGEMEPDRGRCQAPASRLYAGEVTRTGLSVRQWMREHCPGAGDGTLDHALSRAGLARALHDRAVATLSGGEKTRLTLARAWVLAPALLLLDEPTNHLDLGGLAWLEQFVREYPGMVVVASHDRRFLDAVAGDIWELADQTLKRYRGNYTAYRRQKDHLLWEAQRRYDRERAQAEKLARSIRQRTQWFASASADAESGDPASRPYRARRTSKHARQAKSQLRRLQRLEDRATPRPQSSPRLKFPFSSLDTGAHTLLWLDGVGHGFGCPLFQQVNLRIQVGVHAGLVGPNGCGKTTLLRICAQQITPRHGRVRTAFTSVGVLEQELHSLPTDIDAISWLVENTGVLPGEARSVLGRLGVGPGAATQPLGHLSQGQRTRVALALLLTRSHDLLLLDEPTNHLDIVAREALDRALAGYPGACLLATHDRALLDATCRRIYAFDGGELGCYDGNYTAYTRELQARLVRGQEQAPSREELKYRALGLQVRMARLAAQLGGLEPGSGPWAELDAQYRAALEEWRQLQQGESK
ncbi:MAG: ribosomal protection-like ABC-F family protein [Bacillota bacterium]